MLVSCLDRELALVDTAAACRPRALALLPVRLSS
jgi:hypothetical protein